MLIVCRSQENLSTTKAKQYLLSERRQTTIFFGVETSRFYSMPKLQNFLNHKAKDEFSVEILEHDNFRLASKHFPASGYLDTMKGN